MPIFDNLRGLVPLPKSKSFQEKTGLEKVAGSKGNENYSEEPTMLGGALGLPNSTGIDTSNTIIDKAFTILDDLSHIVKYPITDLPIGESGNTIKDIYKETQKIEEIISNPLDFLTRQGEKKLYDLFRPQDDPGSIPVNDSSAERNLSRDRTPVEDVEYIQEFYDRSLQSSGVRVLKPQTSPRSSFRIKSTKEIEGRKENLEDIDLSKQLQFKGRDSVKHLTVREMDLWDIKVEAYHHKGVHNWWVPPMQQAETVYKVSQPNLYNEWILTDTDIHTDYMPITSFNLDLKSLTTKQLSLFGGSVIQIPELIRYNSTLSFQVVDDVNKRWRRWFQAYSERLYQGAPESNNYKTGESLDTIYNENSNVIAPYKNSSLLVTLIQYRRDHKVISYNQYICTLGNYTMSTQGTDSAVADLISVELSIVGRIDLPERISYLQIV